MMGNHGLRKKVRLEGILRIFFHPNIATYYRMKKEKDSQNAYWTDFCKLAKKLCTVCGEITPELLCFDTIFAKVTEGN